MAKERPFIHPYIPNSAPGVKDEMLKFIGVDDVETLYQEIPDRLRFKQKLDIPKPFMAEMDLKKHVKAILSRNKTC